MNLPMPRQTVEEIVAARNSALRLFEEAFGKIAEADAALSEAKAMWRRCAPGIDRHNYSDRQAEEVKRFYAAVKLPERAEYLRTARKLIDVDCWAYIIDRTDLTRLMDREAKDKLRDQMQYVPDRLDRDGQLITEDEAGKGLPEITVENVVATIEAFVAESGNIFRRGIANVFSKLDRRFRSHDGFKIGSRMILTYFFDEWGALRYGQTRDMMIDIERVFAVLDGKTEATFQSALAAIDADRQNHGHGRRQSEVETDYFRIKGYMNGNAHLWFKRDDLVEQVNKILADWYGETIGDGQTQEADPFEAKTTPARYFGFYPTPAEAADFLFAGRYGHGGVYCLRPIDEPQLRILEPSAGTGNLARRCVRTAEEVTAGYSRRGEYLERYLREYRWDNLVDCVEIQPHLAAQLEAAGIYNRVYRDDFLQLTPAVTGLYDIVVMNPPFDRERDIDHVMHALDFVKPGGALHAIMSAGTEFRETRKSVAFRALMEKLGATWEDLPANSFSDSGTNINTLIVRVRKP